MKSRQEIKLQAKLRFAENRGSCIAVNLLTMVLTAIIGAATVSIGAWLIMPVLVIASYSFYTQVYLGENLTVNDWFASMFDNYLRKVGTMLWMMLWVFLWTLLLYIPGIIKAYSYMLAPYIVSRHPEVSVRSALKLSMRMTNGYKADLFIAQLSFLGWALLTPLTLGIVWFVYAGPYYQTTFGGIYDQLENVALQTGSVTQEQLDGEEVY